MIKENMNFVVHTMAGTLSGFADTIQIPDEGGVLQINKPSGEVIWLAPGTYDTFRMFPEDKED